MSDIIQEKWLKREGEFLDQKVLDMTAVKAVLSNDLPSQLSPSQKQHSSSPFTLLPSEQNPLTRLRPASESRATAAATAFTVETTSAADRREAELQTST